MQFLYISEDGYTALVNDDGLYTLQSLQSLVDGLVDVVAADPTVIGLSNIDVWVNDEGLYRNDFSINSVASYITGRQLVGPVVLTSHDSEGATLGLTTAQINRLVNDGLMVDNNEGKGWSIKEARHFFGTEAMMEASNV